jgi:SNF2 family DNA or RNA helicase
VSVIDGSVSASERESIVRDFQSLAHPQVIVAHPKTAAHGLTLTAASTTIWYGPTHSGEAFEQANNRTDRPGQKLNTRIVCLYSTEAERRVFDAAYTRGDVQGALLDMYRRPLD